MDDIDVDPAAEVPAGSVTVAELDGLVKQIFDKRVEIEAADLVSTGLNKELLALKAKAVLYLKDLGRENFSSPHGTVSINQKWRVNLPSTDGDKAALFEWLRERGIFDKYATVNSNSLNSLYMAEWEAAKQAGEGMTFAMPGIGEARLFEDLGIRKART